MQGCICLHSCDIGEHSLRVELESPLSYDLLRHNRLICFLEVSVHVQPRLKLIHEVLKTCRILHTPNFSTAIARAFLELWSGGEHACSCKDALPLTCWKLVAIESLTTRGGRSANRVRYSATCKKIKMLSLPTALQSNSYLIILLGKGRCMTARDRLRVWDVKIFGSSNLTHKSCGIFVASWGFAHCIGTRLVFHNFFIST